MHSLRSIEKLNDIAVGNHNQAQLLADADASRVGKVSAFEQAANESLARIISGQAHASAQ